MFNRVLIANRGEIAIRVIRACQELGIETVAVYSDVDAHSLHVQLADYAYNIGPADAALSYYNAEAIISAAKMAKADAIHPGYGFLSENADFAQMVIDAGMIFVGPHPETIRKVGNKDAARLAMKQAGLPMTVGSEIVRETEDAYAQAEAIGYPVILKPVAGGGGKSMFVAHNKEEMTSALNKVDLKSRDFYLENYIDQARHIEVQIMADNYGNILHLGERECSLQRRNQKILEEAPSSALTPEMRHKGRPVGDSRRQKHLLYQCRYRRIPYGHQNRQILFYGNQPSHPGRARCYGNDYRRRPGTSAAAHCCRRTAQ